jgi:DNA-binding Lrp family transcriptional regulator
LTSTLILILLFKKDKKNCHEHIHDTGKKCCTNPSTRYAAQLISLLKKLSGNGILRKFGAILRHQRAGFQKNALVMWSVPPDVVENAGRMLASLSYISHCYERKPAFQNKYNLFTMLHAQDDDISPLITTMSQLIHSKDFLILESLQEYKKTSPEYF